MKLIDRIARLARADAHGVVDALEERGLLLRQHLREAELEILQKRARVEALEIESKRLADEAVRRRERLARLDEDVELALAGDREDVARFVTAQLLTERRDHDAVEAQRAQVDEAHQRVSELLDAQERRFGELSARARGWLDRHERSVGDELADSAPVTAIAEEEIDLELLRRRGATEGA